MGKDFRITATPAQVIFVAIAAVLAVLLVALSGCGIKVTHDYGSDSDRPVECPKCAQCPERREVITWKHDILEFA